MSIYKETIKRFLVGGKAQAQVTRTAQLDLAQFYADCASLGATVDVTLFENSLKALPEVARNEAINYLVPGAYKSGMIYGFNSDTKSVLEFPFSRTSSATYIDKNGQMQTAPPNMPRIDYDPLTGECKGYLQEAASTNLITWSNDFSKWVNNKTTSILSGVTTSNGKSMYTITKTDAATSASVTSSSFVSLSNTPYCYRLTLRAGTSNKVAIGVGVGLDVDGSIWGTDANSTARVISGPGVLTRFAGALWFVSNLSTSVDTVVEVTRSYVNAGVTLSGYIYPDYAASITVGSSILASCAQIEVGNTCSSYIETSGAVGIRTADILASARDIVPYIEASVFMNMRVVASAFTTYAAMKSGTGRFWYTLPLTPFQINSYDGVNSVTPFEQPTKIQFNKYVMSYGSRFLVAALNGNNPRISAGFTGIFGMGNLEFGVGAASVYIKALAIIPRQLTDAEHITATTL